MKKIYIAILIAALISEVINQCTNKIPRKSIDNPEFVLACQDKNTFTAYLADTLSAYIDNRVRYTIDSHTSGFTYDDVDFLRSMQMGRLAGSVFLDNDSVRKSDWQRFLSQNGLHYDSISAFINQHIDFYNKVNNNNKLPKVSVSSTDSIFCDPVIFSDLNKMETIAVWEIFDVAGVGLAVIALIIGIPVYLILLMLRIDDNSILVVIKILSVIAYILSILLFIRLFDQSSTLLHNDLVREYTNIISSSL